MSETPLLRYEPNPMLAWLFHRVFEHIEVDEGWAKAVRDADQRGTVVYVLRNLSFVDFFALDYLTKRFDLPEVRFVSDLGLWVLEPMGRGWMNAFSRRTPESDSEDLRRVVTRGHSAALFLKRPAHLLEGKARGKIEGDSAIRTLFDIQRDRSLPILLVPQVFLWTKHPDAAKQNWVDAVLGPREWPGQLRSFAQFLGNIRGVSMRSGEPVDVRVFLEKESKAQNGGAPSDASDEVLVRRLTYTLLRRLERERKALIGPARKPADRLREEVVRSPKLQKVIQDLAGEGEAERRVLTWRALSMVREMEASLDMNAIYALDKAADSLAHRMYHDVEVDKEGLERLRAASKDATLVILPSHKSHVDYVLLAYIFYRQHLSLPLVAAGDNLNFFPVGQILRRAGAFFIRRSFQGDRLYAAVVDAYVRRLLKDGWALEFFLEGGRSRTGKLLPPKLGLLSIVVDATLGVPERKVAFCPVSIGYERFVEEEAFVHELSGGEKKREDVKGLLSTAEVLRNRYGRVNIQFGELLSLESILQELEPTSTKEGLTKLTPPKRRALVTRLAYRVMNEINRVAAVTSGALVATALLIHKQRGLEHNELMNICNRLARALRSFNARMTPSLMNPGEDAVRPLAVREAIELFIRAGHVQAKRIGEPVSKKQPMITGDTIYTVPPEARLSLDLSKNMLVHFFVSRALIAIALLSTANQSSPESSLRDRVQILSRLFKYEFQFRADASFDQIFDEELAALLAEKSLARQGDQIAVAKEAGADAELYASILHNFVEGYRVAARGLTALLKGPLAPKDLVKRAIAVGDKMFLAGEIARSEAVSRPILENAYTAFVDQGYLQRTDGKYALPESFASATAVRTIESRIQGFLAASKEPTAT